MYIFALHCRVYVLMDVYAAGCLRCGLSGKLCLRGNVIVCSDNVNFPLCIYVETLAISLAQVTRCDALLHISFMLRVV